MKKNQPTPGKIPAKDPQDTHLSVSSLKRKPSASIVILVFLGLSLIISMGIAGYLATQNNLLRNQVSQELLSIPTVTAKPTSNMKLKATVTPPKKQVTTGKPLPPSLITEQVITDWKTYEDPKYGFKFGNPGAYILLAIDDPIHDDKIRIYKSLEDYNKSREMDIHGLPGIHIPFIDIVSFDNPQRLSSLNLFNEEVATREIKHHEIIQFAGIDAVRYFWRNEEGEGHTTILAHDDYYIYLVVPTGIPQQDFERLLSSYSAP